MHSITFVVTKDRPTEAVLAAALAPFGAQSDDPKWDRYLLGGRYTGNLIPHDADDTMMGAADPSEQRFFTEISKSAGLTSNRPGRTGPGVDAAQVQNIRNLCVIPRTVVIDGYSHECGVVPANAMLRNAGMTEAADAMDEHDVSEERAAIAKWRNTIIDIMSRVPDDHWLSVVDCHD